MRKIIKRTKDVVEQPLFGRNPDGTTWAWGLPGEVPPGVQDALAWRRAQARGEVKP
jgi:hypothetical protein